MTAISFIVDYLISGFIFTRTSEKKYVDVFLTQPIIFHPLGIFLPMSLYIF